MYNVYVKIDGFNHIVDINSSAFLSDYTDFIMIDSGYEDKYHHAQNNYLNYILVNIDGTHNYKLVDNKPVETNAEEKAAELDSFPVPEPTKEQILQSQIDDILISLVEELEQIAKERQMIEDSSFTGTAAGGDEDTPPYIE